MSSAGNIEAIRDWANRYFYTKSKINQMFIDPSGSGGPDLSKADILVGNRSGFYDGRYVRYLPDNTVSGACIFVPCKYSDNMTSQDPFTNPFLAAGNHFKVSCRVYFTSYPTDKYTLFGASSDWYDLPNVELNTAKKIWAGYTTSSSRTWTHSVTSGIEYALNTWYRVEVEWDGAYYYLRTYDADDNLLDSQQTAVTGNWFYKSTAFIMFGGVKGDTGHWAKGMIIDIANTYWTVNGVLTWGCDFMNHEGV